MPPRRSLWIDIQSRTLTRWLNVFIPQGSPLAERLFHDLKDGSVLIEVAEVLSGKIIKGVVREPSSIEDCKRNILLFLKFLQKEDALPFEVTADDIIKGNKALTLSVVWMLVLQYQLRNGRQSREKLMTWVKH